MGFLQGVQAGNQTNTDNRQEKQQKLSNYIKGFEQNKNGDYAPNERGQAALDVQSEKVNQQLTMLQEQNKMMQSTLNEKSMTDGIKQLTLGQVKDGWSTIQRNKPLADMLKSKGVHQLAPVDWNNDKELWEGVSNMNVTPEMLQDPKIVAALNSTFTKVLGADGKWKLSSTENLVQASGTLAYLPSNDKEGMINRFNQLGQILNGKVLTSAEQKAKDAQVTSVESTSNLATITADTQVADITKFFEANPDKTWGDYLNTQAKPGTAKDALSQIKLEKELKDQGNMEGSLEFVNGLRARKEPFVQADYDKALAIQGKRTMTSEERKETTGKLTTIDGFITLNKELKDMTDEKIDVNAWTKIKTSVASVFGPDFVPGDEKEILRNLDYNTNLGIMTAKYVKYMSGAAVTEGERNMYSNLIRSGNWSNLEAMKISMASFTDTLVKDAEASIDSISTTYPANYIEMKALVGEYKTKADKYTKATNSYKPAEEGRNPFRSNGRPGGRSKPTVKAVPKEDDNTSALDLSKFNG